MNKLKYAGLIIAGILVNVASTIVCSWFFQLFFTQLKEFAIFGLLAVLIICGAFGFVHALFKKLIRNKLRMKTMVYSLLALLLPFIAGVAGFIVVNVMAANDVWGNQFPAEAGASWLLWTIMFTVSAALGALFARMFDVVFLRD